MTKLLGTGALVGLGWLGAWAWYFDNLRQALDDFLESGVAEFWGPSPTTILAVILVLPTALMLVAMVFSAFKRRISREAALSSLPPSAYRSGEMSKHYRYQTGL